MVTCVPPVRAPTAVPIAMQLEEESGLSIWFEIMRQAFKLITEEAVVYWTVVMTEARLARSDLLGDQIGRSEVRRTLDNRVRSIR